MEIYLYHIKNKFESQGNWVKSKIIYKNDYLRILTCYSFICSYRSLIWSRSHIKVKVTYTKIKVTHQGQGQIKITSKKRFSYAGDLHYR